MSVSHPNLSTCVAEGLLDTAVSLALERAVVQYIIIANPPSPSLRCDWSKRQRSSDLEDSTLPVLLYVVCFGLNEKFLQSSLGQ